MFGLNGKSFFSTLIGHWAVHFQGNPEKIWKRNDLGRTMEIVKESNADVIGICEVLEGQYEQMRDRLMELGYGYVYFTKGHKLSHYDMHVIEVIASKLKCRQLNLEAWQVEDKIGGGEGFGAVYLPEPKTTLLSAHLALSTRKYFYDQINFIAEKIRSVKGKVILIGDFNLSYQKIRNYFPELNLVSEEIKTCSNTPIMKLFYNKDVDHIFVKGFKKKKFGTLKGYSDHLLLWADLI